MGRRAAWVNAAAGKLGDFARPARPAALAWSQVTRILLVFQARSYRPDAYVEAAHALGVELVLASEQLSGARRFGLPLHQLELADGARAAQHLLAELSAPLDGVIAADEASAVVAAELAQLAGLRFHAAQGVQAARDKRLQRKLLQHAQVPVPAHALLAPGDCSTSVSLPFPCVVKPAMLSGSQGVLRANNPAELARAVSVVRGIVRHHDSPLRRLAGFAELLIERYVDGPEVALEGMVSAGVLTPLALFDKPDPLVGPTFEETLYVTPSRHPAAIGAAITQVVDQACRVLGLCDGPIHAELRLSQQGPVIIEVAARSIGGLCSRMLERRIGSLERRLLRAAAGMPAEPLPSEPPAVGVMMLPVPASGVLRRVSGLEQARAVVGIDGVTLAISPGEVVRRLPHGNQYLGFAFAHADEPAEVERRLRQAHRLLRFELAPLLPVVC